MPKLKFTITVVEDVNPEDFAEQYEGSTTIQECAKKQQEWLDDGSFYLPDIVMCSDDIDVPDIVMCSDDIDVKVEAIE